MNDEQQNRSGCPRVRERLPALVDGALPELDAARDALGDAPDWRADLAGLDARLAAAAALLLVVAAAGLGWLDGPLDGFTRARPWDRALSTLPRIDPGAFGLDTAEDPR